MSEHVPVLLDEVLALLRPRPGGVYVDATVGLGGHAEAILERIGPTGRLIGIDRDAEALALAQARLSRFGQAVRLVHADFARFREVLRAEGVTAVDGVVMDLGVSSWQLSRPERGFSFQTEGPLDMRMDRSQRTTAADLVNRLQEDALRELLATYGEERYARRIARAIVRARPLRTTTELARVVERAIPRRRWPRGIHPATRTFQALRIAVNRELETLEQALPDVVEGLGDGGRLCVITFHSLEDRIVKHTFLRLSRGYPSGPRPSARAGVALPARPVVRLLTRRPIRPSAEEVRRNPRARSARLRAVERVASMVDEHASMVDEQG